MENLREKYFKSLSEQPNNLAAQQHIKQQILDKYSRPEFLYKYCNINTAHKILGSNRILLQPPDNFNDPFDCLSGVSVRNVETEFGPSDKDKELLEIFLKTIPKKFQLAKYNIIENIRCSYCFAISCFTSDYHNHLMWSHYADNHKGVCLEFNIRDILTEIHPCFYSENMPDVNWQSDSLNLPLIKASAWSYENEWRFIRRTVRPVMRILGQITLDIHNMVATNDKFSQTDLEDWGNINSELWRMIEDGYNNECNLFIKPSRLFLGVNFVYNSSQSSDVCRNIVSTARSNNIPISQFFTKPNSFELQAGEADQLALDYFEGKPTFFTPDEFIKRILP